MLKPNQWLFLLFVGLAGWVIPGAGHLVIKEKKRAAIIFVTIIATFIMGLYVGSIGVVNPQIAKGWYFTQMMNSPIVAVLVDSTSRSGYHTYAWPNEIGQIYTSTSGLLNLLCIVNAVYMALLLTIKKEGVPS
jgi:uncharacterized membrane protein YiaA